MTSRLRAFFRHFLLQAGWNYDRMQHLGVAFSLLPELQRVHRTPEALRAAVLRHLDYFNTQPYMAAPLLGAAIRLEEEVAAGSRPPEDVGSFKASIMGSYGAIGDSFFWGALKPFAGVVAVTLVMLGAGGFGPVALVFGFDAVALTVRAWGFFTGTRVGPMVVARLAKLDFAMSTRRLKMAAAMVAGMAAAVWASRFHTQATPATSEMIAFPLLVGAAGAARRGASPAVVAAVTAAIAAAANRWLVAG